MKTFTGFKDTRKNKEDFALTPYLFWVWVNKPWPDKSRFLAFGIGLTWGWWAVCIGLAFNPPESMPDFITHKNEKA